MEVVSNGTTNNNEDSLYYPVKPTKLVSRQSDQTQQTARCSDFSDFSPDALGEIGFVYKQQQQQQQDDSARTRSTVNIDDSFRTREDSYRTRSSFNTSSRLSFSQRYDSDLQSENEELKLELINVQAERDDLKTQISLMSWEMAQLRDQLKLRESQLVKQELAHTAAKRASFESDKSHGKAVIANNAPDTPKSKRTLLGRGGSLRGLFKSSSKRSLAEEEGLPITEVSVPTVTSSPKKNRRSMLKRIFSGKGKDKFDSTAHSTQEQQDDSMRSTEDNCEPEILPLRDTPQVPRVTMAGYQKNERVHVLHWSRTPIEEETSISGDSDMVSTTTSEHFEEDDDKIGTSVSARKELEHEVSWYREAPGMSIQWKRVPATPVLNVQWKRIPSSRKLTVQQQEEATPVMNIKWERIPSSRTLQAVQQEPVINIKWERVPSRASIQKYEPVLNIQWERIPSARKLLPEKEQEPVLNIKWERIPSSRKLTAKQEQGQELVHNLYWYRIAPTPVLNIEWKRIPSSRKLQVKQEELVHEIVWSRMPFLDITWERVPATRDIFTIEEEYPKKATTNEPKPMDIRWERLPSEPIMNVQWERVPSSKQLQEDDASANSSDWETCSSSSDDSSTSPEEEEEDPAVPTAAESKAAAEYESYLRNSFSFAGKDTYDDCSDDDLDLDVLESLTNAAAAATQNLVQMHSLDNAMLSPTAKPLKSCLKSPDAVKKKSVTKHAGFSGDDMEVEVDLTSPPKKRGVMIRESINQVNRVSKIRGSAWDNCFFTEDEMAEFKYEAFMEECGLTEDDF